MQQELLRKKKEIIELFLKNGVLISSELLGEINDYEYANKIFDALKSKHAEDLAVLSSNLSGLVQKNENLIIGDEATKENRTGTGKRVKIIFSHKENIKKRELQDFVKHFNNRFKALEKILRQRQELQNPISIGKIMSKREKENLSIIGIVSHKQITKNGNILLTLEDPTGQIKIIVNKNKPQLFHEAKNIVLDEVIGAVGVNVGNFIFANDIIWPDIPNKDIKKSDEEKFALFLSDLHVGSSKFLPDDFEKFLKWINCELGSEQQRNIAKNVDYIFIAGDLVDGVGIYPGQDKELEIKDIYEQYAECARLLKKIPSHIPLIICPGNHDAMRISEPQPILSKEYAKPLHEMNNVIMVTNPSIVNIHSSEGFSGFDVLLYHGYSFDHFVAEVDSLRNEGGYDRPDLIMKFLMKRRHLGPTHSCTLYVPDANKDNMVIEAAPDFFLSGHIHKSSVSNYKNVTLICGSCWQGKTLFQEKVGHHPEPSRVPIVNLKTRDVKILKFGQ